MSTGPHEVYVSITNQFSGHAAPFDKRFWIRSITAPIYFCLLKLTHVCRLFIDPIGFFMVPITIKLYHQTATYSWNPQVQGICYGECNLVTERRFEIAVADFRVYPPKRDAYRKIITAYLKSLQVPQDDHAEIIEDLCEVILLGNHGLPINVWIRRVTLQRDPRAVPSFVEGLEKLTVDSLEGGSAPCAICIEDLDLFRGIDKQEQQTIIRLPCLHLYHRDCIVPWLERRQVCPLCRYSIQASTKDKLSSRVSAWLQWPMLLVMSSGGIITATLLCRLLKRAA